MHKNIFFSLETLFEPLVFFVLLGLRMTPPRVMSSEVIFRRSGQITSFKLAGKTCISGPTLKIKDCQNIASANLSFVTTDMIQEEPRAKQILFLKPTYLAPKVELFFAVFDFPYHVVGHFCIHTQVGGVCFVGCHAIQNILGRRIEVIVFNACAVEPDHLFDV